MPTSNEIHLMLPVSGGGDAFGPFFATLALDRDGVESLLRKADIFRAAHALNRKAGDPPGNDLYQITYFDYLPEFYESGKHKECEGSPEEAARLEDVFDNEDYPTSDGEDHFRDAPEGLPEHGSARLDYCKLIVVGSMARERPDKVDFHWVACIKHTDEEIETGELKEEDIRALLGRLA
jgi:hypothetical protein